MDMPSVFVFCGTTRFFPIAHLRRLLLLLLLLLSGICTIRFGRHAESTSRQRSFNVSGPDDIWSAPRRIRGLGKGLMAVGRSGSMDVLVLFDS